MSSTDATQSHLRFEDWKPVVGYEGRYDVSDQGRVWSHVTNRILRPCPTSRGYLSVVLSDGSIPKQPRTFTVADLVLAAFVGPKPDGYEVDHGRRGKQCNALTNIEYVTHAENNRRNSERGVIVTFEGSHHTNAKLSDSDVKRLREWRATGKRYGLRPLARELGVSETTASHAANGKTYKNVI